MLKDRRYPSPGEQGGRLVRSMIATLRAGGAELPLKRATVALSGGADSMALALLLSRYGRRIVEPGGLRLLHVNHHWRAEKSDEDERFVTDWAQNHDLEIEVRHVRPPIQTEDRGQSWEDHARRQRKEIYAERSSEPVLTAHHADDQAETLLWRLFTGAAQTHGAGICLNDKNEWRPLLRARKAELLSFLAEEKQTWCEDETNQDTRLMRARMRCELLPVIESIFPRAVERLSELGWSAQTSATEAAGDPAKLSELEVLFRMVDFKSRRAHWKEVDKLRRMKANEGEIHLPGGWKLGLTRAPSDTKLTSNVSDSDKILERWTLEKRTD